MYCSDQEGTRRIANDESVYFDVLHEHCFFINTPWEYRRLGYLCEQVIGSVRDGRFAGGLIWLHRWDAGAAYLQPIGLRIIENQRRACGDTLPLDLAPAQFFEQDEPTDLQVLLMTALGNGWSGCFVPSRADFFVQFQASHRLFFYCETEAACTRLSNELEDFAPHREETA